MLIYMSVDLVPETTGHLVRIRLTCINSLMLVKWSDKTILCGVASRFPNYDACQLRSNRVQARLTGGIIRQLVNV